MKFKIGDVVYHGKYGIGSILGVTKHGNDIFYNVRFKEYTQKGILSICEDGSYLCGELLHNKLKELQNIESITTSKIITFIKENNLDEYDQAIVENFVEEHNRHFAEMKLQTEKRKLQAEIDSMNYISIAKAELLYENNQSIIDKTSLENQINEHNNKYYESECKKYKDVFIIKKDNAELTEDEVKEYELNDEQKRAVITDEDNCLVIAGAGCGKTSMILAKVDYLIHKGVDPKKILVLSYTKKTVEDLNKKLRKLNTNVEAMTFHSLGCKIVGQRYNDNINVGYILKQILHQESQSKANNKNEIKIENKNNLFEKIKELFLKFIAYNAENKEDVSNPIADTIKKYEIDVYEKQHFPTLQAEINYFENQNKSIKGESVKSLAEVKIANFLFLNDIKYKYEDVYDKQYFGEEIVTNKQYRPDFHIKSGEKELWLEHFGVTTDEQGNKHAAWCSEEDKYLQQMEEKINTFKENFIYTTQDMLNNNTLLDELREKLENNGIILNPISDDKIKECLDKLFEMQKYKRLIDRVERAINLFKSQNEFKDILSWKHKVLSSVPITKYKAILNLFDIIKNVYEIYEDTLEKNKSIDFNDMIALAIDNIHSNKNLDNHRYDYILIDEYQDITNMRYKFIKALKEVNNAKVLAVGDDWQSIYGFNGSDISLFTEFSDFFKQSKELYITQTHRNSQQLLEITKDFIGQNTFQKPKELKSYPGDDEYPIKAVLYHQDKKNTETVQGCENISKALMIALDDILAKRKDEETVCVIGRYNINKPNMYGIKKETNNEIYYIENTYNKGSKTEKVYQIFYQGEYFNYSTIHKAKGLEWDYTIFLDGMFDENKTNSFPCALPDDNIVAPLLHSTDTYPYSEERRILYVALTRCKKLCYWLISEKQPTLFYTEKGMIDRIKIINDTFEEYCKKTEQQLCPLCHNGIITQSEDNRVRCSNFQSCNCSINAYDNIIYLNHEKLSCGSSRAIIYNSTKKEWFVGCANWSKCSKRQECNEKYHILDRHYKDILDLIKPQIDDTISIDEKREKLKELLSK